MMLDNKQIRAIFLFKLKVCYKAAETIHNINNAFGPETANERTGQEWFKKFCKGVLKMRSVVTSNQKVTTTY